MKLKYSVLIILFSFFLPMVTQASSDGSGDDSELGVKIIHAEGKIFYNQIFIHFSTEFEKQDCDFLVERSSDGVDWYIRGKIKSHGQANAHAEYEFIDQQAGSYQFYRIRKMDENGIITLREFELDNYSVEVKLNEITIQNTKKLNIEYTIDQDQQLLVRIYNRIGEEVVTKLMPFDWAGQFMYQLDVANLKSGNYLLVVTQTLLDKSVAEMPFQLD